MNTIILHGDFRERYGESFRVDIRDPIEAYRALACQLPGFRDMVRANDFYLVREMPNGSFALDERTMFLGMENARLHFVPNIDGASSQGTKGGMKLVLGIALIGASFLIPGAGTAVLFGHMTLQAVGISMGLALAFGGLSLILSPTPNQLDNQDTQKNSYLFSGNSNPSGQNIPIPVGFGTFRVPGIPVATEIVTGEYDAVNTGLTDYADQITGANGSYLLPTITELRF